MHWLFCILLVFPVVLVTLRYYPRALVYKGEATAHLAMTSSRPENGFGWVLFGLPGGVVVGADIPASRLRKLPDKNTLVDIVVVSGALGVNRVESIKWCNKRGFESVPTTGEGAIMLVILWLASAALVAIMGAFTSALIYVGVAVLAWVAMSLRRAAQIQDCACKEAKHTRSERK